MEVENNFIYSSKKREVIGIFMMNAITFVPYFIATIISLFITPPPKIDAIALVCGCLSTAGSPLVQVLFRQDNKDIFKYAIFENCNILQSLITEYILISLSA